MGVLKVIVVAHQDKTTADPRWVSVTFWADSELWKANFVDNHPGRSGI